MSSGLLSLVGIRYSYPDADDWELDVPAFEVRPSEIVGVLGPNGSGKSGWPPARCARGRGRFCWGAKN